MTVTNIVCYGAGNGSVCLDIVGVADFTFTLLNTTTGVYTAFETSPGTPSNGLSVVVPPPVNGNLSISVDTLSVSSTSPGKFCVRDLGPGAYQLQVIDNANGGCSSEITFNVAEPTPLELQYTTTFHGCNNEILVDIVATAQGGTPDYVYAVTIGPDTYNASSGNFVNLVVGNNATIDVSVEDSNFCTKTLTLNVPGTVTGNVQVLVGAKPPSCYNACDGELTVNVTGGKPAYQVSVQATLTTNTTYNYSNLFCIGQEECSGSKTLTGLCAGTYTVTVIDANGCTYSTVENLTEPERIGYEAITHTALTCNECCNGCIEVQNITGAVNSGSVVRDLYVTLCEVPEGQSYPTPIRVYVDGQSVLQNGTVSFCGLMAGNYKVCIYDEFGCMLEIPKGIPVPAAFTIR